VVNSAGLDSDNVAEMVGIDIEHFNYKLHYCKGQYFRLNGSKNYLIKRLIYPVSQPKSAGLGIHATLDLSGSMRLGPDTKYLNPKVKDYSVDSSKKHDFYLSASKLMPFLEEDELFEDTAGIRPKLQPKDGEFRDFIISEESRNGLENFINLIGMESPGLTASPAIAKFINKIIAVQINKN